MSTDDPPRVVSLANDIAIQFEHRPLGDAAQAVANHIILFWDPAMRSQLTHLDPSKKGRLSEVARAAAAILEKYR